MFTVKHRMYGDDEGTEHIVYAVRVVDGQTQFLFYDADEWMWIDSTKYRPVSIAK